MVKTQLPDLSGEVDPREDEDYIRDVVVEEPDRSVVLSNYSVEQVMVENPKYPIPTKISREFRISRLGRDLFITVRNGDHWLPVWQSGDAMHLEIPRLFYWLFWFLRKRVFASYREVLEQWIREVGPYAYTIRFNREGVRVAIFGPTTTL